MALTDEGNSGLNVSMPVQPMSYGGGYGGYPMAYPVMPAYGYGGGFGDGFGGFGDSWIILFLFAMMFGGGWGGMGGFGNMFEFPWLLNGQQNVLNGVNANTNAGFNQAALTSAIGDLNNSVVSGFGDVQLGIAGVNQNICQTGAGIMNAVNQGFASTNLGLCQGFNGVNNSIFGAQAAISQQINANEIANLNRSFAEQTANVQGFNGVQAQLAQCCCDNRLATAQTQNIVQVEAAASRASASADTQKILDKLCALELDGVKGQLAQAQRENVALQNAVNMATMQASQTAQTAQILAGQAAEIDGVYNRLKNCPVGTYNVCNPLTPSGGCPSCAGY